MSRYREKSVVGIDANKISTETKYFESNNYKTIFLEYKTMTESGMKLWYIDFQL